MNRNTKHDQIAIIGRMACGCIIGGWCSILMSGCIIVPVPLPEHYSRENHTRGAITEKAAAFVTDFYTTREEILLAFGEPDMTLNQQQVFAYMWTVNSGFIVVGAGGGAGPGSAAVGGETFRKSYAFVMEFNDKGIMLRHGRLTEELMGTIGVKEINDWVRQ